MQSLDTLAFAAPRPLFQLPATYVTPYAYDVSRDEQRFLVIAPLRRVPTGAADACSEFVRRAAEVIAIGVERFTSATRE
jgi:hypothetical protein